MLLLFATLLLQLSDIYQDMSRLPEASSTFSNCFIEFHSNPRVILNCLTHHPCSYQCRADAVPRLESRIWPFDAPVWIGVSFGCQFNMAKAPQTFPILPVLVRKSIESWDCLGSFPLFIILVWKHARNSSPHSSMAIPAHFQSLGNSQRPSSREWWGQN